MIIREEIITEERLKHIYNTIQGIIKNQQCYYSQEEIEKLKKDKNNVFIGEKTNEEEIIF